MLRRTVERSQVSVQSVSVGASQTEEKTGVSESTNCGGTVVPLRDTGRKTKLPMVATLSGVLASEDLAKERRESLYTGTLQVRPVSYLTLVCKAVKYLRGCCVPRRDNVTETHCRALGHADLDRSDGLENHRHQPCRRSGDDGEWHGSSTTDPMEERNGSSAADAMEEWYGSSATDAVEVGSEAH